MNKYIYEVRNLIKWKTPKISPAANIHNKITRYKTNQILQHAASYRLFVIVSRTADLSSPVNVNMA